MFDLSKKTVLVAGGAGYLGVPVCCGLAEQGAAVMIADINQQGIDAAIRHIRDELPAAQLAGCVLDIGNEASCRQAVDRTVAAFGGLHAMVNMTCVAVGKRVEELAEQEFDKTLHVNLVGSFTLARESARVMAAGGSIVMFSSMYGQVSPNPVMYQPPMNPNPIEYGVAKAGIIQMVRYLSVHWASRGLRVNAVAPGPFPNIRKYQRPDDQQFLDRLAKNVPLGRVGRQHECAGPVAFLVSDDASFITGQTLAVNGGWTVW